MSLGEFRLLFILPLFLQSVIGYDALETGVILLALAGWLLPRQWPRRPFGQSASGPVPVLPPGHGTGSDRCAAGADHLRRRHGLGDGPGLFIYGAGVGFTTAQLAGVILSEVPIAESGQASAAVDVTTGWRAIGTALLGAVRSPGSGGSGDLTDLGFRRGGRQVTTVQQRVLARPWWRCLSNPTETSCSRAPQRVSPPQSGCQGFVAAGLISRWTAGGVLPGMQRYCRNQLIRCGGREAVSLPGNART